jgi:hypothetical protein
VTTPLTDRENLRRVTLLLDALDQERQDEAGRRKEYAARIELLTTELLKVRDDIKHGQGSLFTDSSGAAGSGEGEARAAAAGVTPEVQSSLPSSQDLDAHEDDATQRRRNSGDPSQR